MSCNTLTKHVHKRAPLSPVLARVLLLAVLLLQSAVNAFAEVITTPEGITLSYDLLPWSKTASVRKYVSGEGRLVIPEKVTYTDYDGQKEYEVIGIQEMAFENCKSITEVVIPASVKTIGRRAFYSCTGLTGTLVIPDGVTKIEPQTFNGCRGLTAVELGSSLTEIKESAFRECTGITGDLVFPESLTSIGEYAFNNCSGLTSISFGSSLTTVGNYAFGGCSGLTDAVVFPESLTTIGEYAFKNCSGLTSISFGSSLTTVGNYAFGGCSGLTGTIILPESLNEVGSGIFQSCASLEGISFPSTMTSVPRGIVELCIGLKHIEFGPSITEIGEWAFNGCTGLDHVDFTPSMTKIGENAFRGCTGLQHIEFGPSITEISSYAFYGCTGLTRVEFTPSITEIGTDAFRDCTGLEHIEFGHSITEIGFGAFWNCTGLKGDLLLPEKITKINSKSFYGCSGLTNAVLGPAINSVAQDAFSGCSGLKKVAYPSTISNPFTDRYMDIKYSIVYNASDAVIEDGILWGADKSAIYYGALSLEGDCLIPASVSTIGENAFALCEGIKSITVEDGDMELLFGNDAFSGTSISKIYLGRNCVRGFSGWNNLKEIQFGNSVTALPDNAFRDCTGLTGELNLPASLTSIGSYAFSGTGFSGELRLPESLTSIGSYAFYGTGFTGELILPNQLTSIGSSTFEGCTGFTGELILPNQLTSIGSSAFESCTGFTGELRLPESLTSIESSAFESCTGLSGELRLPASLTSIGSYAFLGCTGFTSVLIGPNVRSVENSAFSGCSGLVKGAYPSRISRSPFSAKYIVRYDYNGAVVEDGYVWNSDKSALYFAPLTLEGDYIVPASVTSVGENALGGCAGITALWFEDGEAQLSIGENAFVGTAINKLYLGRNWKYGVENKSAFSYLDNLTEIQFGNSVTALPDNAFRDCTGLTGELYLPETLTSISSSAFNGCSGFTGELRLPVSLTSIGSSAFSGTGFTGELRLPESLTSIESYAFSGCTGFTGELILTNQLTSIGSNAFRGCTGFTSVLIGPNVGSVDYYAFYGCSGLVKGAYPSRLSDSPFSAKYVVKYHYYDAIVEDGYVWNFDKSALYYAPITLEGDYVVPASVTSVGENALGGCAGITALWFEDSDTKLSIGKNAFAGTTINKLYLGRNWEYGVENQSAFSYLDNLTEIQFGNSVTALPDYAFSGCTGLTGDLNLPAYLASIGSYAFSGCTGFTGSIYFPETLTSIGSYAFSGCTGFTGDLNLPNQLASMKDHAFEKCTGFTGELNIPAYLASIAESAFDGCSGITDLTIEDSDTQISIGKNAFANTGIQKLYVGRNWKYDVDYTSAFSNLVNVTIGNKVTALPAYAFRSCEKLTGIILPPSVNTVGWGAFDYCSGLKKSAYPAGLANPFDRNQVLAVEYPRDAVIEDNVIYSNDHTELYFVPIDYSGSFEISPMIEKIWDSAFSRSSGISDFVAYYDSPIAVSSSTFRDFYSRPLNIPEGTVGKYLSAPYWMEFENIKAGNTEIGALSDGEFEYRVNPDTKEAYVVGVKDKYSKKNASIPNRVEDNGTLLKVRGIGANVFADMSSLKTVSFPKNLMSIGKGAFSNCTAIETIAFQGDLQLIDDNAFQGCTGLASVTFNDNLQTIGNDAFQGCTGLPSVTFNDNLQTIGNDAFKGCTGLPSVTFNDNLQSIGNNAFKDCTAMETVNLGANLCSLGEYAFQGCTSLASVGFGYNLQAINTGAFQGCTSLTSLSFNDNLEEIGTGAFQGCTSLASLSFNNGLREIGTSAFQGCTSLASLSFNNGLREIGTSAFKGCTSLASLSFNDNLEEIGTSAFQGCTALTSVTFNKDMEVIGESAFQGCNMLASVSLNDNLYSLGAYAFKDCPELTVLNAGKSAPAKLCSIGEAAFSGCSKLNNESFTIIGSEIGGSAFYGCKAFKSFTIPANVTKVGANAFGNSNITSFTIADGVDEIAFEGSLPSVTDLYAGRNWTGSLVHSVGNLVIGNAVTDIPASAFSSRGVKTLTLGSSVKTIGDNAFRYCSISDLVMSPATETIGEYAFASNDIKHIAIGANVTTIGEKAFDGSNALEDVSITALTPPDAQNTTFSYYDCPLYVPAGHCDTYYDFSPCWYRFEDNRELVEISDLEMQSPSNLTMKPGETVKLSATMYPANASLPYIFWRSSDPTIASVDNEGNVTFHGSNGMSAYAADDSEAIECKIIATTLYADGPVAEITVSETASSDIDGITVDGNAALDRPNDVYNLQGVLIKRNATEEDIKALSTGVYIIGGKKVMVK